MTLEELKNLRAHYRTVKEDATREIARLRGEIAESEALLPELEEKRIAAMKAANEEEYNAIKNRIEMHQERITSYTISIINLEEGHLIDTAEFNRISAELNRLQARITNETAAKFMSCIQEMRRLTSDYESKMRTCDSFGTYLQEEVYRKRLPYDHNRIESRMDYGFAAFSKIVRAIGAPGTNHYMAYTDVEKRAANVLKAEAAASLGMKDKAEKAAESE